LIGVTSSTFSPGSPPPVSNPWREPVRGGHPDARHLALTGAEQLHAMLTGDAPLPPMTRLIGVRLIDAAPGTATFELPLSPWLRGIDGRVPSGLLTMPVDAAMACAIMTGLPPHIGLTTTELALRQVRPAPFDGRLLARGRVIHGDGPLALAEASLRDESGLLIAHASSTCFIMEGDSPDEAVAGEAAEADDSEDPWQRPAPAWEPGDEAAPPLGRLTGLHAVRAHDGEATYALPATRWLCAPPPGRVQGGAVAMLAEAAITGAVGTAAPPGTTFSPVELKLNYVRPLAADGREARARARVINAGRRFMVAGAEVRDADERLIAVASGSAMAAGEGSAMAAGEAGDART
jgi:uncharacterized protein (TIGR00369 family)